MQITVVLQALSIAVKYPVATEIAYDFSGSFVCLDSKMVVMLYNSFESFEELTRCLACPWHDTERNECCFDKGVRFHTYDYEA